MIVVVFAAGSSPLSEAKIGKTNSNHGLRCHSSRVDLQETSGAGCGLALIRVER